MARLDQIAASLKVIIPEQVKYENAPKKPNGHKRRAWLNENEEEKNNQSNEVYNPLIEKGSINPFHKPLLSTPLINPINNPPSYKGSISPIKKPLDVTLDLLRSNPLKITRYLFELSRNEKERITNKITQTDIMNFLSISKDSARTAMRFLLKNKLVDRVDFKSGKMGWSKYKLKTSLFIELNKAYQKGSITPLQNINHDSSQKGSNSSSNININTINQPLLTWNMIDVSPLSNIGLNEKHIAQLKLKNIPEVVQESIYHFSYAIKFNPKMKKYNDLLSVLMGVLRKGEAWVEADYKSTKEIAQKNFIEQKRTERERLNKLEEEAYHEALIEWTEKLTTEEIDKIAPHKQGQGFVPPQKVRLNIYFKDNIWQKIKKNYILSSQ